MMVTVQVQQGWLRGEQLDTVQGDGQYYSFKGIPYAEPPLGKLRFKAPRPPLPWNDVRQATEHGPKCPQIDPSTNKIIAGSEDCLYLNVYTPNLKPASPLAVMVFIHGGGFKTGDGNTDFLGPDFLVSHGVVLVTFNYRLEAFGFLCLDNKEVPGNAALKDQVAALKWVKENIVNFGGDPNNVTIFGESAGAACTALHILSPMSKGLFQRAIPMSGVPNSNWSLSFAPARRAFMLGKLLGLETNDPDELLQFLQRVPAEQLVDTHPIIQTFEERRDNMLTMYNFSPVVEKDFGEDCFISENAIEMLKTGKVNDVDVLIGHTNQEMLIAIKAYEDGLMKDYSRYPDLIVPRKLILECNPNQILLLSDKIHDYYFHGKAIGFDTLKEVMRLTQHTTNVYDIYLFISKLAKVSRRRNYLYIFSCESGRNLFGSYGKKYGIRGASHADDVMYLFNPHRLNLPIEKNSKEYELVQLTCKVFTNFAKYGNPTPDSSLGLIWPEYDNTTKPYVDIGDKLTSGNNPEAEAMEFWNNLFASVGSEYVF